MNDMVAVRYPVRVTEALRGENGMALEDAVRELRELSLVKLYDEGKISSGFGAEILGISRGEFIDLLSRHGVYFLDLSMEELESELAVAEKAARKVAGAALSYAS